MLLHSEEVEPSTNDFFEAGFLANQSMDRKSKSMTIQQIFRNIICKYEQEKPQDISIIQISKTHNIQHRRVYDLFNFLTSFGVCIFIERKKVGWVGMDNFYVHLQKEYECIESQFTSTSMKTLFELGPSPSLGKICSKLLCLYLFLDVTTLQMKKVIKFLHDPRSDIKSLERRVYLVLSFLEILSFIRKGNCRGEYILTMDTKWISQRGLDTRMKNYALVPSSLESLMHTFSPVYYRTVQISRRAEFESCSTKDFFI